MATPGSMAATPGMLSIAGKPQPAAVPNLWKDLPTHVHYPAKNPTKITEFERTYPVDEPGSEAADNARVWRVYRDRVNDMDTDTISGWNDAINFLLVFAGLFSAVMTAFLIEVSKGLEADHQVYSSQALAMLVSHASGANVSQQDVGRLDPTKFQPAATTRLTNALWFPSLVLSLIVSMLSILAKQWIIMFASRMRRPVSHMRHWVHRHRFFRDGIERWHLDAFVSSLSVALHLAVVLFFIGLNVRLYSLDLCSFIPVLVLTVLMLTFYIAATIAPLFYGDCPTLTPLLVYSLQAIHALFQWNMSPTSSIDQHSAFEESAALRGPEEARDVATLAWMIKHLPAGHDVDVALDAFGPLQVGRDVPLWPTSADGKLPTDAEHLYNLARSKLNHLLAQTIDVARNDPAALARALRTSLSLEDADPTPRASPYIGLMGSLTRSLAHDLFPLGLALDLKLASMNPREDSETLRTRLVSIFDLLMSTSYATSSGHPTTSLMRRVVLGTIEKTSRSHPGLLRLVECTQMMVTFGRDPATRRAVHVLTTNTLLAIIPSFFSQQPWRPMPPDMTWYLRAMQAWSFVVTRYETIQQSDEPLPPEVDVWACFAEVFRTWSESEEDIFLTSEGTWDYLQPMSVPPLGYHHFFLPQEVRVALGLVARAAASGTDGTDFKWSSSTANILFNLLDLTLSAKDFRSEAAGTGFHLTVILYNLVQSSRDHAMVLSGLRAPDLQTTFWDHTPLNLLVSRHRAISERDSVSLWYLIMTHPLTDDEERHRIDLVALISADLAILAQVPELGIDARLGWAELVGHGFGNRFLHSPYTRRSAVLAIARHGRVIDPEWWDSTKVELLSLNVGMNYWDRNDVTAWYPTAHGFETPAAYIEAVEDESPCSSCMKSVSQV